MRFYLLAEAKNFMGQLGQPLPGDIILGADHSPVELWGIDRANYYYFNGLAEDPGAGTAAPGNPETNLSGGVLGVFTVAATSRLTVTIP